MCSCFVLRSPLLWCTSIRDSCIRPHSQLSFKFHSRCVSIHSQLSVEWISTALRPKRPGVREDHSMKTEAGDSHVFDLTCRLSSRLELFPRYEARHGIAWWDFSAVEFVKYLIVIWHYSLKTERSIDCFGA